MSGQEGRCFMAGQRSFLISDECLHFTDGSDPAEVDDNEYVFRCLSRNDVACTEPGGFVYDVNNVVLLIVFGELYQVELTAFIEVICESY